MDIRLERNRLEQNRLEQNKEVIHRLTASFNERDRSAFDRCYAEQIVVHASNGADRRMDHDEHWEEVQGMFRAFPDLAAKVETMLAEDDRVFVGWTYSGTHSGKSLKDVPELAGKHASWTVWCVYRLVDGRVAEAWNIADAVHLYSQLGLTELPKRE